MAYNNYLLLFFIYCGPWSLFFYNFLNNSAKLSSTDKPNKLLKYNYYYIS